MNPYADSKLLEDAAQLDGIDDHVQVAANVGLSLDSRDHEFAPTRGTSFIIRGDVGYAPVEDTLGIYVDVGHVF